MQPYLGPPSSPIPMQPMISGSSRLLGSSAPMMQAGASSFMPGQVANMATSRAGGGLLARLLGGSGFASGSLGGGGLSGGGLNLTTILNHTQRVMGITQQVAPMVQQYGPFVKNVPTLWKMMRSMKSPKSSSFNQSTQAVSNTDQIKEEKTVQTNELATEIPTPTTISTLPKPNKEPARTGMSVPKLYV
ncbi:hypothetical protein JCM19046_2552 [Bacillus sp. JCM 19046]|nr:hypothetical protein JCM19045_1148 [Bacillus sp. JCM 19045]GAF18011.1 hypothetical protein JCM19046_2552 [Bacillus sp. JCM 19046]